jgi:hypothetical protein
MVATNLPELDATRVLLDEPRFVKEDDMNKTALAALTIIATIGLGACGGHSDAEDVRHAVHDLFRAAGSGDGKRACAMLTAAARRQLADQQPIKRSCEETMALAGRLVTPAERDALDRVEARRIVFADDHTKAIIEDGDVTVPEGVTRVDNGRPTILVRAAGGAWKIADLG